MQIQLRQLIASAAITLVTIPALAGPAPWYTWRSKLDGKTVCTQTSPGEGWVQDGGPYKDARCAQPGTRN